MIKDHSQAVVRSRWLLPLFSLGLGVVPAWPAGWAASWARA